jgi:hypothetical protein
MAMNIRRTTSIRGEVKTPVPCRKILWHVKRPYVYEKAKFTDICSQVSPVSLLGVPCWYVHNLYVVCIYNPFEYPTVHKLSLSI